MPGGIPLLYKTMPGGTTIPYKTVPGGTPLLYKPQLPHRTLNIDTGLNVPQPMMVPELSARSTASPASRSSGLGPVPPPDGAMPGRA